MGSNPISRSIIDEIKKHSWDALGLLEGLDNDVDKENMSDIFDTALDKLISHDKENPNDRFTTVLFPICRRVYNELENKNEFDFDIVWEQTRDFFQLRKLEEWVTNEGGDIQYYNEVDWESEYTAYVSSIIAKQLKDKK